MTVDATSVITDLLARGHAVRFRAGGDSMHPIIRCEDYLHVEPASGARIRRGDVVLTLAERGLTAHRVIAVQGDTLITRGDNSDECDFPIDVERILGRVTHVERDGRMKRIRRASSILLMLQRVFARLITRPSSGLRPPPDVTPRPACGERVPRSGG